MTRATCVATIVDSDFWRRPSLFDIKPRTIFTALARSGSWLPFRRAFPCISRDRDLVSFLSLFDMLNRLHQGCCVLPTVTSGAGELAAFIRLKIPICEGIVSML